MQSRFQPLGFALGLLGAALGGVLGYFAFFWIAGQGLYALAMPGAMIGLGCGLLSGIRSRELGIVCAVSGLGLCIWIESQFRPFLADDSLGYFLRNLGRLQPVTWLMLALAGVFGYWFGVGRERYRRTSRHAERKSGGRDASGE